jgi:hypothetical protein
MRRVFCWWSCISLLSLLCWLPCSDGFQTKEFIGCIIDGEFWIEQGRTTQIEGRDLQPYEGWKVSVTCSRAMGAGIRDQPALSYHPYYDSLKIIGPCDGRLLEAIVKKRGKPYRLSPLVKAGSEPSVPPRKSSSDELREMKRRRMEFGFGSREDLEQAENRLRRELKEEVKKERDWAGRAGFGQCCCKKDSNGKEMFMWTFRCSKSEDFVVDLFNEEAERNPSCQGCKSAPEWRLLDERDRRLLFPPPPVNPS